jgi:hypothetical protein
MTMSKDVDTLERGKVAANISDGRSRRSKEGSESREATWTHNEEDVYSCASLLFYNLLLQVALLLQTKMTADL